MSNVGPLFSFFAYWAWTAGYPYLALAFALIAAVDIAPVWEEIKRRKTLPPLRDPLVR